MAMLDLGVALPPRELCIVRLSAIGDTCHTVPVVRAIQRAWPQTRITWVIGATEHRLLEGLEGVEFAVLEKSRGVAGYLNLRRRLRGRRFPLLLHMHASMRANLASRMINADVRLGFDRQRARDGQWYFCNRHIPARAHQHVMDGLFEFAEALGIEDLAPRWDIPLGAEALAKAAGLIEASRPSLVISPCTGQRFRNFRNWSARRYAEVADYAAHNYGARIVITGGNTTLERTYADEITRRTQTAALDLVGSTSLKELLAVLARVSVVLCPDSGPAHMASAVGTPVVGLYATSNRHRTGPYFSQHLVVDRYPEAVAAEFGTTPVQLRWGQRVRDAEAMSLITVADVIEKLDLAFAERGIKRLHRS
ncbi:MAG: glycosyltransferase family 9 protein [Gammaproteobacteria bacterium]|jgi:heptosyltransferase I